MSKITFIGDVHGKTKEYLEICSKNEYTVQVGDMGYNYSHLKNLDEKKHKFIGGNHEHWPTIKYSKNYLGRYGSCNLNNVDFFFVSGGYSIDWKYREKMFNCHLWTQTWFNEEELSEYEMTECKKLYENIKPKILVCHEPPRYLIKRNERSDNFLKGFGLNPETFTTKTGEHLNDLVDIHKPDIIIHGHMHYQNFYKWNKIQIYSLGELGIVSI